MTLTTFRNPLQFLWLSLTPSTQARAVPDVELMRGHGQGPHELAALYAVQGFPSRSPSGAEGTKRTDCTILLHGCSSLFSYHGRQPLGIGLSSRAI